MALLLVAALGVSCRSTATTSTGPSPVKCQVLLTPVEPIAAAGGTSGVGVSAAAECVWDAVVDVEWIRVTPMSGQGAGQIDVRVTPNLVPAPRHGEIKLNGVTVAVSQSAASCTFEISPRSLTTPAGGGSGNVAMNAPAGCPWGATSHAAWVSITAGATGDGPGAVRFSVASNSGAARVGAITIGNETFTVTQQAPTPLTGGPCVYTVQPAAVDMRADGGTAVVAVDARADCSWAAATNVAWLSVAGGSAGTGGGSVTIAVAPNAGAVRVGTLTIAGQALTVSQEAHRQDVPGPPPPCVPSITPSAASVSASGGAGPPVGVSIAAGCGWNAASAVPWLTIASGSSGSGNGTVTFSAGANLGAARTGTLLIAGLTFTVTQAAVSTPACVYSLNPASSTASAAGGVGTALSISAPAGCAWSASTTAPWLTVTGGASGSGSGTVQFTAAVNTGPARTGTVVAAGQTHTVTQGTGCSVSLSPAAFSGSALGGAGAPITVNTATGCSWTATTTAAWISILSGATGSGAGTVTFRLGVNLGTARTGTIAIGNQTFTVHQSGLIGDSTVGEANRRD